MNRKVILFIVLAAAGVGGVWLLVSLAGDSAERKANSPDAGQRIRAAEELRTATGSKALQTLRSLAMDRDEQVAIRAVKSIGDKSVQSDARQEILKELLAQAQNPAVRGEAAAAMGNFRQADTSALTGVLQNDRAPEARIGALRGLSRVADRATVPEMFKALTDPDPNVRFWALNAINRTVKVIRFEYDTSADPSTQTENLQFIRKVLRERNLL